MLKHIKLCLSFRCYRFSANNCIYCILYIVKFVTFTSKWTTMFQARLESARIRGRRLKLKSPSTVITRHQPPKRKVNQYMNERKYEKNELLMDGWMNG